MSPSAAGRGTAGAGHALRLGAFGGGETGAAAVSAQEFLKPFLPTGQEREVGDESGFAFGGSHRRAVKRAEVGRASPQIGNGRLGRRSREGFSYLGD